MALKCYFWLGALTIRELALTFALAMAYWAYREEHWPEVVGWGLGILAFASGLLVHAGHVAEMIQPEALRGPGWLAFGGWPFLLKVNQWNLITLILGGLSAPSGSRLRSLGLPPGWTPWAGG